MPHTPSPVSTPFPYTTLFRSLLKIRTERFLHRQPLVRPGGYALSLVCRFMSVIQGVLPVLAGDEQLRLVAGPVAQDRSEEHTSELQSPCKLVSRLLLEKKNMIAEIIAVALPKFISTIEKSLFYFKLMASVSNEKHTPKIGANRLYEEICK